MQAFPWNQLPHVSRAEAIACSAFNARVAALDLARAFGALSEAGAHAYLRVGPTHVLARPSGHTVAVALGFGEDALSQGLVFETETPFAAALIGELLRKPDERPKDLTRTPTERLFGAFAASMVHMLRKGGTAPRVLAAGPAQALVSDLQRMQPVLLCQPLQLELRGRTYRANLIGAPNVPSASSEWSLAALATLGATQLSIPIVVAVVSIASEALATLESGDIILAEEKDEFHLAAPRSEWALRAVKKDGQWIFVEQVALPWSMQVEQEHNDESGEEPMKEALENVPVVARVELGAVELSAAEWSRLRPGDTLALGKKPGELVTLRVAGLEVARGELVVFDGQTGVRIVERITAQAPRGERTTA